MLPSMGLQRVGRDIVTKQQQRKSQVGWWAHLGFLRLQLQIGTVTDRLETTDIYFLAVLEVRVQSCSSGRVDCICRLRKSRSSCPPDSGDAGGPWCSRREFSLCLRPHRSSLMRTPFTEFRAHPTLG